MLVFEIKASARLGSSPKSTAYLWFERAHSTVFRCFLNMTDRRTYESRIEALRADAELDELTINVDSEQDFWDFIRSTCYLRRAALALMNNGNIRAVWKAEDSSHLGIPFLGDGEVQYVIFRRRSYGRKVSRVAGIDTLSGIKNQIAAFDLISLMYR